MPLGILITSDPGHGPGDQPIVDDVRFGSLADIKEPQSHVRFTPRSRHAHRRHRCLLSAKSGLPGSLNSWLQSSSPADLSDESVSRELAAAQKRVMRAWTKLKQERENLINSLREVEHEMTAMNPVVKALLRSPKNLRPLSSIHKPIKCSTGGPAASLRWVTSFHLRDGAAHFNKFVY